MVRLKGWASIDRTKARKSPRRVMGKGMREAIMLARRRCWVCFIRKYCNWWLQKLVYRKVEWADMADCVCRKQQATSLARTEGRRALMDGNSYKRSLLVVL